MRNVTLRPALPAASTASFSSGDPNKNETSTNPAIAVSCTTKLTKLSALKKTEDFAVQAARDLQRLRDIFGNRVSASSSPHATDEQPEAVPKSERIRQLLVEIEQFQNVLVDLKREFEEQAIRPVLHSFERSRDRRRQIMHDMNIFQFQVQTALELFDPNAVSTAQIDALNKRRNEIATAKWPLAECEHAGPDIQHVSSMSELFQQLAKINLWCANNLGAALAKYADVRQQLLAARKEMLQAEQPGLSPNIVRKARNKNFQAVSRASTYFFKFLIPASEVAIQRICIASVLADMRPEIEERIKEKDAEKKFASHLMLRYIYEKLMNDARLDDLDENLLDTLLEDSRSDSQETLSTIDLRPGSPGADIVDAMQQPQTCEPEEVLQDNIKAPFPQTQLDMQANPLLKKRGRRAPRQRPEPATSVRHPKYDRMQSLRASQQRKQAVKKVLDNLTDEAIAKKISALGFYNAYSALRTDHDAGWKAHLRLLDDVQFNLPQLAEMRAQLEEDVLKLLDNADRDPDAGRIFSLPYEGENPDMHEKALLFLTEFRACMPSNANTAYFGYAATRLGTIANRASTLAAGKRDILLLGRAILPRAAGAGTPVESSDVPRTAMQQPEIFLSEDQCYVEVIDTAHEGSKLYFENGFRTSVVRAAELLASAAIGSTRTANTPGKTRGRPSTPRSAAWMQSLAHVVPRLLESESAVEHFSETAIQARIVVPD
ncbi:MAG: hypothetical protein V4695_05560 [Pseudomonadota bacterium]